jgi:nucleotide-binding universal stress UspA family protein
MSTATLPLDGIDELEQHPITVPGTAGSARGGPVLAALDDDTNAGAVLRHASGMASRLGVSLRATYVWSDCRPPDCPHHRRCHRDLGEASRLLTELVDRHLSREEAERAERDVLHDGDPVRALTALSAGASMLVVGASSDRPSTAAALGSTVRALLGATHCPVVVVPHRQWSATGSGW